MKATGLRVGNRTDPTSGARDLGTEGSTVPAPPPRIWPLFLATFLSTYTFAVANISVPGIQAALDVDSAATALVIGAYTVSFAACLIVCGRLGDRFGRRRLFRIGVLSMIATSALAALAPNVALLIVGRLLQGVAAAITTPQILSSVQAMLTGHARARAVSLYAIIAGVGTIGGQILGGVLTTFFPVEYGWRAAMASIGGIALIAFIGTLWMRDTRSDDPEGLDLLGTVLVAGSLLCLVAGLTNASSMDPLAVLDTPRTFTVTVVLLVGAVIGFVLLGFHLRHRSLASRPSVLPLHVIREPGVRLGVTLACLLFMMLGAFMYNFAVLTQQGFGWSPLHGGVALVLLATAFVVSSSLAPRLQERMGPRVMVLGAFVQALGLAGVAALAFSPAEPGLFQWIFQVCGMFTGGGQGLMMGPLVSVVMNTVPNRVAGLTGGLVATGQQAGMGLGVATLSGVFTALSSLVGMRPAFGYTAALTVLVSFGFAFVAGRLVLHHRRAAALADATSPSRFDNTDS
ncbi:MFS transporter [Brevibacterium litoralis]|uniref:MFS transporter n=1 Tax=Brevibacterium litoralis TaxID=3138935 RepID=UPI0032F0437F